MKERPILFSAPMVKAILDGSKVQTRRPIKTSPELDDDEWSALAFVGTPGWNVSPSLAKKAQRRVTSQRALDPGNVWAECLCREIDPSDTPCLTCEGRYGVAPWKVGDRLWVKETFAAPHAYDHLPPRLIQRDARIHYAASEERGGLLWRPSIHMPRCASRIILEITAIRAERVQDITDDDALREGIRPLAYGADASPRMGFRELWERTHRGSWDRNDAVWVVEFQRVDG